MSPTGRLGSGPMAAPRGCWENSGNRSRGQNGDSRPADSDLMPMRRPLKPLPTFAADELVHVGEILHFRPTTRWASINTTYSVSLSCPRINHWMLRRYLILPQKYACQKGLTATYEDNYHDPAQTGRSVTALRRTKPRWYISLKPPVCTEARAALYRNITSGI